MFVMMQAVCVATAWLEGRRDNSKIQQAVNTDKIIESYLRDKDLSALKDALELDPCERIVAALETVLDDLVTEASQ